MRSEDRDGHSITGIHHVQLAMPAGREAEAEAFYGGVLGLDRVPKPTGLARRGGCWFRGAKVEVHLGVEEAFRPAAKAHPAFVVHGLAVLRRRLEEAGAPVAAEPPLQEWIRPHTTDPFGNRIELMEGVQSGSGRVKPIARATTRNPRPS